VCTLFKSREAHAGGGEKIGEKKNPPVLIATGVGAIRRPLTFFGVIQKVPGEKSFNDTRAQKWEKTAFFHACGLERGVEAGIRGKNYAGGWRQGRRPQYAKPRAALTGRDTGKTTNTAISWALNLLKKTIRGQPERKRGNQWIRGRVEELSKTRSEKLGSFYVSTSQVCRKKSITQKGG